MRIGRRITNLKVSADELISCFGSSKVTAIDSLVFVYLKLEYVNYFKNPKDTVWNNQKTDLEWTQSLFVDDLKVYQESHKTFKGVKETILQPNIETGACYVVAKWKVKVSKCWIRE